jgi:hypothetical protein
MDDERIAGMNVIASYLELRPVCILPDALLVNTLST